MASLSYYIDNMSRGTLLSKYIDEGTPVPMYELQKWFSRCPYPYGTMVMLLLEEAGLRPETVIDLTFGLGKFWSCWRPKYLIGYDIRRLDWVVEPNEFHQTVSWTALHHVRDRRVPRPDLVAVDPPWQRCRSGNGCRGARLQVGGAWWFRVSKGVGTPELILESAARLAEEARVPLLVHFENRWVPQGFSVLVEVYWRPSLSKASPDYRTWWGIVVPGR